MRDNTTTITPCTLIWFSPRFQGFFLPTLQSNFELFGLATRQAANSHIQLKHQTLQVDERRTVLKTSERLKLILCWLLNIPDPQTMLTHVTVNPLVMCYISHIYFLTRSSAGGWGREAPQQLTSIAVVLQSKNIFKILLPPN